MGGVVSHLSHQKFNSNIRFVEFHNFEKCGRIPRAPDDIALTTDVTSLPSDVSLDQCFVVFISHRWTRPGPHSAGFEGRPEPDSNTHEKHALCVAGVRTLWETYAKKLKYCYIWMDYSCLNQNVYPARELWSLTALIRVCDCLFTPVVDPSLAEVDIQRSGRYTDYQVAAWAGEPEGYCHRSWCRLELYCGGFTPLAEGPAAVAKRVLFSGALHTALSEGRRPHFLFNTSMLSTAARPMMLPPPQRAFYPLFHPLKGFLTKTQDKEKIQEILVNELIPMMRAPSSGEGVGLLEKYVGEYNECGQREGYGRVEVTRLQRSANTTSASGANSDANDCSGANSMGARGARGAGAGADGDGDGEGGPEEEHSYEGQWLGGAMEGLGTYRFGTGSSSDSGVVVFVGNFVQNQVKGYGKCQYRDGSCYEGQCQGFRRMGYGVHMCANGDKFEGEFVNDLREGHGRLVVASDSSVYEGSFQADKRSGQGVHTFAGGVYDGWWRADQREGPGTCRYLSGDVYSGDWNASRVHGTGEFKYANGDVYTGDFVAGREHGCGKFTSAGGSVYEGGFVQGARSGQGRQMFSDGKVYEGGFEGDRMCGFGRIDYPDGTRYEGGMKDGMRSGEGVLVTEGGDVVYRGGFRLGKKHGRGEQIRESTRDGFVGEWVWDTCTQIIVPRYTG